MSVFVKTNYWYKDTGKSNKWKKIINDEYVSDKEFLRISSDIDEAQVFHSEERVIEFFVQNIINKKEWAQLSLNSNDIFTCQDCKKKTTRGEIRKIWKQISFCKEESKRYYCGCNGWDQHYFYKLLYAFSSVGNEKNKRVIN